MGNRNLMKKLLSSQDLWDRPETRMAVRKNFAKVGDCGTPALGCEVYSSGTEEKRCYHRCKSRFCASCGYRATLLWLEYQEAVLPDIPYTGNRRRSCCAAMSRRRMMKQIGRASCRERV